MRAPLPGVAWSRGRAERRVTYAGYMSSPAWFARREAWVEEWHDRHGDGELLCVVCDAPWSLSKGDLHHATYDRLGCELFEDLVAMCRADHVRLHAIFDAHATWRRMGRRAATRGIVANLRARSAGRR